MSDKLLTTPIPDRGHIVNINPDLIEHGPKFPKTEIIKLFSFEQWEDFIWEWSTSLEDDGYHTVEKCSGAGDKGRDIVAYLEAGEDSPYDNYQCKHYDHALYPGDIWLELGKLCYYTWTGAYNIPENYYFVAPQGIGTTLSGLLKKPNELKEQLKQQWDARCKNGITKETAVPLEGELLEYVEVFDFKIIKGKSVLKIIEQHGKTNWHAARFGGGLPQRPALQPVPARIQALENVYVTQLFQAYGEREKNKISSLGDLNTHPELRQHFSRAREQFHSAEALRSFSRDTLPPGEYDKLQTEFFHGVVDTAMLSYPHGFERVLKTVQQAMVLAISHPLQTRMTPIDRGGICHQLVNEERIKWVDASV